MKKIIIIYICICAVTVVSAKSMKELWVSMPDSLLPYLNAEKRMALTVSASEKIKTLETVVERLNAKVDSLKTNMNYDSIYIESEKRKLEIYQVLIRKLNELAYSLK